MMETMAKALVEQSDGVAPAGMEAVEATLDAHLGALPEAFEYNGAQYTPASFRDAVGIDPATYPTLTSFTHHPFGASFVLEVPDNHAHGRFTMLNWMIWKKRCTTPSKTATRSLGCGCEQQRLFLPRRLGHHARGCREQGGVGDVGCNAA